jgi:hypothetical protein
MEGWPSRADPSTGTSRIVRLCRRQGASEGGGEVVEESFPTSESTPAPYRGVDPTPRPETKLSANARETLDGHASNPGIPGPKLRAKCRSNESVAAVGVVPMAGPSVPGALGPSRTSGASIELTVKLLSRRSTRLWRSHLGYWRFMRHARRFGFERSWM